uniref:Putative RxLR effector n=1 Tax=Plasmopara viticola TaxID=143451 RepID=A0A650F4P6_PLAVT|nr:putative RxLR effector [Plasmopara viticola]
MRGTLATALLLITSSRTAAESYQIDPRQLSPHVVETADKMHTTSSPRKLLRDNATNESRTIEKVITSAMHGITDPSGASTATRDTVREILDLNAFPKEAVRPRFDLNVPPSETVALLAETSEIPQQTHASTSTASDIAVSSGRTTNQRTAKPQARLGMGRNAPTRDSLVKKPSKKLAALKVTKSKNKARKYLHTSVVDAVYTMFVKHLETNSVEFDPTKEETKAILYLILEKSATPPTVSALHSNYFKQFENEDLEGLKEKLGINLMSTLSLLASLKLSSEVLNEIQRLFVWYLSLERLRAMYCFFFEFYEVDLNEIKKLLPDFRGWKVDNAARDRLFAELRKDLKHTTKLKRSLDLLRNADDVMAKHDVEEETAAAVRKAGQHFVENEHQFPSIPAPPAALHSRPGKQHTDLSPYDLQTPVPEKNYFQHIMSNDQPRGKQPRRF